MRADDGGLVNTIGRIAAGFGPASEVVGVEEWLRGCIASTECHEDKPTDDGHPCEPLHHGRSIASSTNGPRRWERIGFQMAAEVVYKQGLLRSSTCRVQIVLLNCLNLFGEVVKAIPIAFEASDPEVHALALSDLSGHVDSERW